jgi:hypothetical protein
MRSAKIKEIRIMSEDQIRFVSSKRLGASPRHTFLVTFGAFVASGVLTCQAKKKGTP